MMRKVTISGASDDLIEIEGDINDEVSAYDYPKFITFDDGTVVKAEYSPEGYNGMWKVEVVREGTSLSEHIPATGADADYTDKVILTCRDDRFLKSFEVWKGMTPSIDELVDKVSEFDDWHRVPMAELWEIYNILHRIKVL
jgi:hypothetical protein